MMRLLIVTLGYKGVCIPLIILLAILVFLDSKWLLSEVLLNFTSHEVMALQALVFAIAAAGSVNFYHHLARMKFKLLTSGSVKENAEEVERLVLSICANIKSSLGLMAVLLLITSILVILRDVSVCEILLSKTAVSGIIVTTYLQFYLVLDLTKGEMELVESIYSVIE